MPSANIWKRCTFLRFFSVIWRLFLPRDLNSLEQRLCALPWKLFKSVLNSWQPEEWFKNILMPYCMRFLYLWCWFLSQSISFGVKIPLSMSACKSINQVSWTLKTLLSYLSTLFAASKLQRNSEYLSTCRAICKFWRKILKLLPKILELRRPFFTHSVTWKIRFKCH